MEWYPPTKSHGKTVSPNRWFQKNSRITPERIKNGVIRLIIKPIFLFFSMCCFFYVLAAKPIHLTF